MTEIIVLLSFIGIAIGRLPVLRMNRATIALVGAVAVVVVGGLGLREAFASIDLNTVALLFAVMILNVNLRYSGFFRVVGRRITLYARTPQQLLALIVGAAGVLSALFLNDTIVLMMTPLVVEICELERRNPVPFLIGLATSANIGSMTTVIGNPQNILIGASSGIHFVTFTSYLAAPGVAGLVVAWAIIVLVFRRDFTRGELIPVEVAKARLIRPLFVKSMAAVAVLVVGLALGYSVTLSALASAALLLLTRRIKAERILRDVDWSILVFFSGLFILVDAVRMSPVYAAIMDAADRVMMHSVALFTLVSVALSNLVSNVPAVMILRPYLSALPHAQHWWILLAMATTLAGNLTLLGSVANLIVAETAKRHGVSLGFWDYLKAGVPITAATTVLSALYLSLVR